MKRPEIFLTIVIFAINLAAMIHSVQADFVTYGNGYGSKWGGPVHGTPSDVITWSFMTNTTTLVSNHPLIGEISGGASATSNISLLRSNFDFTYGSGAFNQSIQNAFNTWSTASGGRVVFQLVADNGAIAGDSSNLTSSAVDIRIGAFSAATGTNFAGIGAVGYGPPGDDLNLFFRDALAGDIIFNANSLFQIAPGNEGDVHYTGGVYRNDLEGLMLHELGHAAIGLGHPANGLGDVMYVGPGAADIINRQLSPSDLAGLQSVYGITAVPEPSSLWSAIVLLSAGAVWTVRSKRSARRIQS
jgi:hypothetical protein